MSGCAPRRVATWRAGQRGRRFATPIAAAASATGGTGHDDDGNRGGRVLPIEVEVCKAVSRNSGSRSLRVKAGSYIFDRSTKNIAAGAYTLDSTMGNDPTIYHFALTLR
jgi:hypothetical protein